MAEIKIAFSPDDIELLVEACDALEYWEHRDELPHDSGYITIINQDDFDERVRLGEIEANDETLEAWERVKALRSLQDQLRAAAMESLA